MAAIVNDRDALIMGTSPRYTAPTNMDLFLSPASAIFKQSADLSTASPNSFTFQATPLNLVGTITFTASAGLTITVSGNTATLTYANFTVANGTITASMTVDGVTYTKVSTVTKLADGAAGSAGTPGATGPAGTQTAPVFLYQWGVSAPAAPTGTSTLTWPGTNGSYTGSDGWAVTAPANPGTPGLNLWVVTRTVTAAGGATTTTGISYAGLVVSAWTKNGATGGAGAAGANGIQNAAPEVYQWAATIPVGPVGSPTWNWGTRLFGAAPTNWTLAPGAPVLGSTLWAATVQIVDTAAATTTAFNWTSASIAARGYAGTNGAAGGAGAAGTEGASYVTAYVASNTSAATSTPAATTGKASVPAVNAGGVTGTWAAAAPTTLAVDQRIWQVDGIYNPATNQIVWQFPYWSVWKVGSLSAITLGVMGNITAGSIDLGSAANSWHVDPNGNMWSGATTMAAAPFSVSNVGKVTMRAQETYAADGTLLFSTGVGLTLAGAPAGTKNSEIAVAGRNLMVDSAFERGLRPWTTKSAYVSSVDIRGAIGSRYLFIQSVNAAGSDNDAYVNGDGISTPVTPGKTYIFSMDYATAQSSSIIGSSCGFYLSNGGFQGVPLPTLDTASNRLRTSLLWVCPAGVTSIAPRFGIHTTGYAWIAIYNFMLAEGNKDTGWTPAPEDSIITTAAANAAAVAAVEVNLVARGSVSVLGNTATKVAGSNVAWDSDVYSKEGYVGGAAAQATIPNANAYDLMFGLNTDPLTSGSFDTIDYALRVTGAGTIEYFQSGSGGALGAVSNGDVLAVTYDGSNVRWLRNGSVLRTVAAAITVPLFFDSSFASPGAALTNIRFMPMSSNGWASIGGTGKPADNATVGGTLGVNIAGQITAANAAALVGANAITNTMFGGDLLSTNWNGRTDSAGTGWALGRASGTLFINDIIARGSLRSGNSSGWGAWPAAGGGSLCYFGQEGFQLGNYNDNKYMHAYANGNLFMPGFAHENGQLTLTNTIVYNPIINGGQFDSFTASLGGGAGGSFGNGNGIGYGSLTAYPSGGRPPYTYRWVLTVNYRSNNNYNMTMSSPATQTCGFSGGGSNSSMDYYVTCFVTDANNRTVLVNGEITVNHGTPP